MAITTKSSIKVNPLLLLIILFLRFPKIFYNPLVKMRLTILLFH
jgi:hypothetical protein